ncbi:MAG: aminotransferase class V-fold PLP-dependent enzyme [Peptococcales bacterium]|jgi:cysteine desulfurase/selenocysteine lyase
MDWMKIRAQFPVTENYTYFDIANKNALPIFVTNVMNDYITKQQAMGGDKDEWKKTVDETRKTIATLINAEPEEIALTKNTSEGLNIAANGIPFNPGDNVILNDNEHPNNIYCWLNLNKKGVEVRWAPTKNGIVEAKDIEALIDERTKAVAVSYVTYMPGNRNDIKAIAKLCNEKGIFLVVDVVQAMGILNVDVKESGIDMLAASGYKGLLAPHGVGFFFCRKGIIDKIQPVFVARAGMAIPVAKEQHSLPYSICLPNNATKFEIGNYNYLGVTSLNAGIGFINSIGIKNIESKVLKLGGYLTKELKDLGLEVLSPVEESRRSGIVCFRSNNTKSLFEKLLANNVILSIRRDSIRASISFYNDKSDADKLLNLVDSFRE